MRIIENDISLLEKDHPHHHIAKNGDINSNISIPKNLPKKSSEKHSMNVESRIESQFTELEHVYITSGDQCLTKTLETLTTYSRLKCLKSFTTNDHNLNTFSTSNLISAIALNKKDSLLATAGVSKKILLYNMNQLIHDSSPSQTETQSELVYSHSGISKKLRHRTSFSREYSTSSVASVLFENVPQTQSSQPANLEYPVLEFQSKSKLSSISWNTNDLIASADYEGLLNVWDVSTGKLTNKLEEHEKRAWAVEFSPVNPSLLASGSDDSKG